MQLLAPNDNTILEVSICQMPPIPALSLPPPPLFSLSPCLVGMECERKALEGRREGGKGTNRRGSLLYTYSTVYPSLACFFLPSYSFHFLHVFSIHLLFVLFSFPLDTILLSILPLQGFINFLFLPFPSHYSYLSSFCPSLLSTVHSSSIHSSPASLFKPSI